MQTTTLFEGVQMEMKLADEEVDPLFPSEGEKFVVPLWYIVEQNKSFICPVPKFCKNDGEVSANSLCET